MVAFGRVIEDDIQDDLDARSVKTLDHIAKLVNGTWRVLPGAIRLMRCKEGDGRIAPIVDQTWGAVLRVELKHGEKFDSRDAQILEIEESFP